MPGISRPFFPIIYVRGYAMTPAEMEATVATPYMGFNLGSTKTRQDWNGHTVRHIFESPLVRLMKDYGYTDVYAEGIERAGKLPAKSVIIYRYYEKGQTGQAAAPTIPEAAAGLRDLIHQLRDQVCGDDTDARAEFRVYLVAHSMGGLVCRCFLQNDEVSSDNDRALVDKVFTYATPHKGIELAGINVPGFLDLWDINNFDRTRMAEYLMVNDEHEVDTLDGKFDPKRFFCLVGTNHKDYNVAMGLSARLAGEMSDGLVNIENATVKGAPRAFVYRSHSGPYGIVNSEEGYQNLTRFLFGDVKVDGVLEVEDLPLPPSIRRAQQDGKEIRASYYFESVVSPRGGMTYKLTERRIETFSAILRKFDEMMRMHDDANQPRWPVLFSTFLNRRNIAVGKAVVFSAELGVSTTGYSVDKKLWFDRQIPGEYLFRDTVSIRATHNDNGWDLRYNLTDSSWGENRGSAVATDDRGIYIPLSSRKGFKGKLRLMTQDWA